MVGWFMEPNKLHERMKHSVFICSLAVRQGVDGVWAQGQGDRRYPRCPSRCHTGMDAM